MLSRSWTCAGRLTELGLREPGTAGRRRRARRVGAASRSTRPAPCTRTTTCAGTAARRSSRSTRTVRRRHRAGRVALRCPYHSWTYDLDGSLLHAPHTDDVDDFEPSAFGLHPVRVDTWGGFVWREPGRGRTADARRRARTGAGADAPLPAGHAGGRAAAGLRGRRQLEGGRGELQRVLPLRPGAPRAVAARARLRPAAAPTSTGTDGIPHREGAWTFTISGTIGPGAASPTSTTHEQVRHKGELVYPNLLLSLSRRARGGVRARARWRSTAPGSSATCCSRRTRWRSRDVRPGRRRRFLGPGQPAGLGDLRVGAARHVVAGVHGRAGTPRWRTRRLDIRRWLLPRELGGDG